MEIVYRPLEEKDIEDVLKLFKESFGTELSKDFFIWKYKYGNNFYNVVDKDIEKSIVVGHYGLKVRRFLMNKKEFLSMGIGDVMVKKEYRALFSKKGIFYNLVKYVIENYLESNMFKIAFGFPMERAFLVGDKMGVYEGVERCILVSKIKDVKRPIFYSFKEIDKKDINSYLVNKLWNIMNLENGAIRDYYYIKHRYLEHPVFKYRYFLLSKFFIPKLLIIKKDSKVIDIVGDLKELENAFKFLEIGDSFFTSSMVKNILKDRNFLDIKDSDTLLTPIKYPKSLKDCLKEKVFYTDGDKDDI